MFPIKSNPLYRYKKSNIPKTMLKIYEVIRWWMKAKNLDKTMGSKSMFIEIISRVSSIITIPLSFKETNPIKNW